MYVCVSREGRKMSRPSRRVAVARLRRLARYLEGLPQEKYDQRLCSRCVLGHARCLFDLDERREDVGVYLGIPAAAEGRIFAWGARVRTPAGKAKQLLALAARLAKDA